MKDKVLYVEIVKKFVREYFPTIHYVMLSGSFVTEFFNEYSDLDVVILSKWHQKTFIEAYEYDSIKIQIIALPYNDVNGLINRDIISRNGAILSMLANGIIIYDENNVLFSLQEKAKKIFNIRKEWPQSVTENCRSKLTTCIEDLRGITDKTDFVFSLIDAYNKLLRLYFINQGDWDYNGKAASRYLKKVDAEFADRFRTSIVDYFITESKSGILSLISEVLNKSGGELHYSTTKLYKEVCDEDVLTIFINPFNNDNSIVLVSKIIDDLSQNLIKNFPKLNFVSYLHREDSVILRGGYVIIAETKQYINESIMPFIHYFHFSNAISIKAGLTERWNYPYIFNPIRDMGLPSICFSIIHRAVILRYRKNCDHKINIYWILKHFSLCKFFSSNVALAKFWNNVFDNYINKATNKFLPSTYIDLSAQIKKSNVLNKQYVVQIPEEYDNTLNQLFEKLFVEKLTKDIEYVSMKMIDILMDVFLIDEKAEIAYAMSFYYMNAK